MNLALIRNNYLGTVLETFSFIGNITGNISLLGDSIEVVIEDITEDEKDKLTYPDTYYNTVLCRRPER